MFHRLLLPAALTFSLASARGDFVIEQKVDGLGQQSGNIVVKIKDTKVRAEIAPQISYIMDGATGDSITLMHAQKGYMKVSAAQGKTLMEQVKKSEGASGARAKPVATGLKENVEQWAAEI